MAKQKSSASSATRKKHAKKAAGTSGEVQELPKEKKPKGKAKGKGKAEPRKKVYIPPVKPRPIRPDPLETLGIAYTIPSDLLVILRRLGKKDAVTKIRALEELRISWVLKAIQAENSEELVYNLVQILPVWFHHAPMLFLHPSRRIRTLAGNLHSSLLQTPAIREQILVFLRDTASEDQLENVTGSWCMLAHDVDSQASTSIRQSLDQTVTTDPLDAGKLILDNRLMPLLVAFIQRAVLDPNETYSDINPIQPIIELAPTRGAMKRQPVPPRKEEEPRSNAEEEFETEQERKARLRIGAMGALGWLLNTKPPISGSSLEVMKMLFSNPLLWTALYPSERPPFVDTQGIGNEQPVVRKAGWSLLLTLLQNWKGQLESLTTILSVAVLRSAWVEPDVIVRSAMWQPLLMFLKEQPQSWELESRFILETNEDSGSESEDEEKSDDVKVAATSTQDKPSKSYREFLTFLELGCLGSPRQGYPSVIVILSTISSSIIARSSSGAESPLKELFTSFWAAIDARALSSLDRIPATNAFLSSLLECTTFLSRRIRNSPPELSQPLLREPNSQQDDIDVLDALSRLVQTQYTRFFEEIASKRLKLDFELAGRLLYSNLVSLEQIEPSLFTSAWDAFDKALLIIFQSENAEASDSILLVLRSLHRQSSGPRKGVIEASIRRLALSVFEKCKKSLFSDELPPRTEMTIAIRFIDIFGEVLLEDPGTGEVLRSMVSDHTPRLVLDFPFLLLAYLDKAQSDRDQCQHLWHDILLAVASFSAQDAMTCLKILLGAASANKLSADLKPSEELDQSMVQLISASLAGQASAFETCCLLFENSSHFISEACMESLFRSLVSSFVYEVEIAIHSTNILDLHTALAMIQSVLKTMPQLCDSETSIRFLPEVFLLAYLLEGAADTVCLNLARTMWSTWVNQAPVDSQQQVHAAIKGRLREVIEDVGAAVRPNNILHIILDSSSGLIVGILDIIPPPGVLEKMLESLPADPAHPSLAVLDLLVPPGIEEQSPQDVAFDPHGFSRYARVVEMLLNAFAEDRISAKKNPWALRHLIALSIYAEQIVHIPTETSSVFNSESVSHESLRRTITKVQQVTTYVISVGLDTDDKKWHEKVTVASLSEAGVEAPTSVTELVVDLVRTAARGDTYRDSRILQSVLQHVLSGVSKEDAEYWMILARKLEKRSPQTCVCITLAVAQSTAEPPRLERYRNELAAGALGIRPAQINSDGLSTLRKLAVTAPDPDSEIVFLPQTRAVNLIKACQQWIASDEDVEGEVESEMTLLFFHLAPILQHVAGSHWDFIFDVVENNLENCSLEDTSTLVVLARSLKMVIVVQQLVPTNRALRSVWQSRETAILTLIRDILAVRLSSTRKSTPTSICRELLLTIVQDLPPALIEKNTLGNMCHLLDDPSTDVQKMAYQLLHASAKRRTEYLVIEAGVSSDATIKLELPSELVDFLQRDIDVEEELERNNHVAFGYMLGWMVLFDLFINASLKVKLGYISHLSELGIINSRFVPSVLSLLFLYEGVIKAPKLQIWRIDEYYVDLYDSETILSLQLLTAHVYYRSLLVASSLVRSWLSDCKDRQLHTAVTTYTSMHFSPVLIDTELKRVTGPEGAELNDDHMTIKVATSVDEITASYSIDENQIEMILKIPSDWPLHKIETKDFNRAQVAVQENRWRAWVLGVIQITWSQSGSIVDGLMLFKNNVSGYFDGAVECAICYSIINATDASRPKFPCSTCNNKFHNACLYQWFNSSHSSSCPLCRSTIIV